MQCQALKITLTSVITSSKERRTLDLRRARGKTTNETDKNARVSATHVQLAPFTNIRRRGRCVSELRLHDSLSRRQFPCSLHSRIKNKKIEGTYLYSYRAISFAGGHFGRRLISEKSPFHRDSDESEGMKVTPSNTDRLRHPID